MSAQYIHLLLNHVPLLAVVFAFPLLVIGLMRRNDTLNRTALAGFITAALITWPVFLSGEDAEHAVEELPGVGHDYIEAHEEFAELTLWVVEALGLGAVVVLVLSRKKPSVPRGPLAALLALSVVVIGMVGYTNRLGGVIRHTEIRSETVGGTGAALPDRASETHREVDED